MDDGFAWPVGTLLICLEPWQDPFLCVVVSAKKYGLLVMDEAGGVGEATWDERKLYEVVDNGHARDYYDAMLVASRVEGLARG